MNDHSGIHIIIGDASWRKTLPNAIALCQGACKAALSQMNTNNDVNISILLTSDRKIQVLNTQYRHKNKPTNVLSFPNGERDEEGRVMLGDIALAWETIEREAVEQDKPLANHVAHLVVHGTLHLLGFDHEKENEAKEMEALEIHILQTLDIPNPYVHRKT